MPYREKTRQFPARVLSVLDNRVVISGQLFRPAASNGVRVIQPRMSHVNIKVDFVSNAILAEHGANWLHSRTPASPPNLVGFLASALRALAPKPIKFDTLPNGK